MLGLAWAVYFGFGVVSASLAALITPIRQDLGLSYGEVGVVLGAWQLGYIAVAYPAGLFVDRVGIRRSLTLGALLVAASAYGRALADGFASLFAAVLLFGFGGPIISIGLPKVIASWFAGHPRAVAAGIYTTGSSSGGVVTLAATNSLVLPAAGSWQATCVAYGTLTAAIALAWWLLAREPPREAATRPHRGRPGAWQGVLRARAVWLVVIVGFTGFMLGHGFRNWLPQILESKGMGPAEAGYLAALPGLSGILGSIVIARLAARVGRKPVVAALLAIIAGTLLATGALAGPLLIPILAIQGFCAGAVLPLLLSMLMDLREVGGAAMGTAAGLYFAVGEIGGFTGPAMMGLLKDLTGSFTAGLSVLAAITLVMLVPTAMLPDPRRPH
jgi:cyanate permease